MKTKLQFASVLFSICALAQAQTSQLEYRPFAVGEKVWETQIGGIKENLYCYQINGETINSEIVNVAIFLTTFNIINSFYAAFCVIKKILF